MLPHTHAPLPPPSTEGSVLLDIGGCLGALVIHACAEQDGLEIEVSPADGRDAPRTHAAVRPRVFGDRTLHCAVITPLPAGEYTVWRDERTPDGRVAVRGGLVTEHRFAV